MKHENMYGKIIETDYNVYGMIKGHIWLPPVECTKEFDIWFTKSKNEPFKEQVDGLSDMLQHITNDGDFQDAKILEARLIVRKIHYKKTPDIKHGGFYYERYKTVMREIQLKGISEADLFIQAA